MTRYDWWGYVKAMIRRYPQMVRKGEAIGNAERREREAVAKALRSLEDLPDGESRSELVRLVFWRQSHTIAGAAMVLHCSETTASRWHRDFIYSVAREFGLMD
nr:MAG TPA: Helix-turn-helix of DDE superfamily endonuclease [Caudoviricetes sp.]DAP79792.1 MAG TPA: Helix-turn-helix of DDE superfamily endonuclease [Caudoviricetes sp.]